MVGLGDKGVAAQQNAAELIHVRVTAGDKDDGNRGESADLGAQGEPALAGELDIQKDQVGLNGVYLRECSGEIHHGGGLISLGLEKGDQLPLDGGIVLNDKNFVWHRKTSFLWFAPDQGQIDLACLWLGVLVEGREALPLVKGQRPLVVLIDL